MAERPAIVRHPSRTMDDSADRSDVTQSREKRVELGARGQRPAVYLDTRASALELAHDRLVAEVSETHERDLPCATVDQTPCDRGAETASAARDDVDGRGIAAQL